MINSLQTELLILQLECHEIEKCRVTIDSGNCDGNALETGENIPLKSQMKNKAQRVSKLESSGQILCTRQHERICI
jgi:hypothetical protein